MFQQIIQQRSGLFPGLGHRWTDRSLEIRLVWPTEIMPLRDSSNDAARQEQDCRLPVQHPGFGWLATPEHLSPIPDVSSTYDSRPGTPLTPAEGASPPEQLHGLNILA